MGVYQNGNVIFVDETFYVETVPGDFDTAVATDPTVVTFSVRDPDSVVTSYVYGVDAVVTNPSVGRYLLELAALTLGGVYHYRVEGTGTVQAAAEGEFTIEPSSVLAPVTTDPVLGPCQSWCDVQDIAEWGDTGFGSDWTQLEPAAAAASQILFELSGRQYSGVCTPVTVRPCSASCGCWGWILAPMSPGAPQVPVGGWGRWGGAWGWGWDGCTSVCGCSALSQALLPGYPIVEITEVKIDGAVVNPTGYRLDDWRYLTRLADPVTGQAQFWPGCQRLDLADTEPNTWSVTYRAGQVPPVAGGLAAAQLGFQLARAMGGSDCLLPAGVTSISRQGITVQRAPFTSWGLKGGSWATGIPLVDAFLSAYNPSGLTRPTAVWSPDIQQFGETLG